MAGRANPIDGYLAGLPAGQRAALGRLRRAIRAAAPDAEECLSYGMPAFRLGKVVAGFAAYRKHLSYFPFSGTTLPAHAGLLRGWERTKSALHFTPERPLPASLVRTLVRARIAEIGEKGRAKGRAGKAAGRRRS